MAKKAHFGPASRIGSGFGGTDWKQAIQDEKLAQVMEHPEEVVQAARQLFENIRAADYDAFLPSKKG